MSRIGSSGNQSQDLSVSSHPLCHLRYGDLSQKYVINFTFCKRLPGWWSLLCRSISFWVGRNKDSHLSHFFHDWEILSKWYWLTCWTMSSFVRKIPSQNLHFVSVILRRWLSTLGQNLWLIFRRTLGDGQSFLCYGLTIPIMKLTSKDDVKTTKSRN